MSTAPNSRYYQTQQLDGVSALLTQSHLHSFPAHYHDTYQLTLNHRGVFKNQVGQRLLHALPGQTCLTHPGEVHTTLCDEQPGHSFFTLYLPPTLLAGSPRFESVIDDHQIQRLLVDLQFAIAHNKPHLVTLVNQLTKTLLARHQADEAASAQADLSFDLSELTVEQTPFSLQSWATHFGMDRFKFLRLFKRQTGLTPNQYVILQRIRNSQQLLAAGEDLTEVALDCGFYDLPHFHRHFKKIIGVTPAVYQSAHH